MDDRTYKQLLSEVKGLKAAEGMDMNTVIELSDDLRQLLTWIIRKNAFTLEEMAGQLSLDKDSTQRILNSLVIKGFVEFETEQQGTYHANVTTARFSRKYRAPKDIWKLID